MKVDWRDPNWFGHGVAATFHRVRDGERVSTPCGLHTLDTETGEWVRYSGIEEVGESGSFGEPVFIRFENGSMLSDDVPPVLPRFHASKHTVQVKINHSLHDILRDALHQIPQDGEDRGWCYEATITAIRVPVKDSVIGLIPAEHGEVDIELTEVAP